MDGPTTTQRIEAEETTAADSDPERTEPDVGIYADALDVTPLAESAVYEVDERTYVRKA